MAESNHPMIDEEEEAFFVAMQMTSIMAVPWSLKAAVDLRVFDIIAKEGPGASLSVSEIASHITEPVKNPDAPQMLERLLCLLVSHSILSCSPHTLEDGRVERRFGLTRVSKYFLKRDDGVSLSWFISLGLEAGYPDIWKQLKNSVLEGGMAFEKVQGSSMFEFFNKNPNHANNFNQSMFSVTTIAMEKLVEIYKGFEGVNTVVDVGGGVGTAIGCITKKFPSIKGINFDLQHVIETAPQIPGVEHVAGDMFESIPKADVVFLKYVLHNWGDEPCLKLLRNCHEALPPNGKVIIMELVYPTVPEANRNSMKTFFQSDVVMLTFFSGGKERSEEDLRVLGKKAGFASLKTVCCVFDYWVFELHKSQ